MKVVGLGVVEPMKETMGHVNDSKGGGRGIDGSNGRVASREGAVNHIFASALALFPELHVLLCNGDHRPRLIHFHIGVLV